MIVTIIVELGEKWLPCDGYCLVLITDSGSKLVPGLKNKKRKVLFDSTSQFLKAKFDCDFCLQWSCIQHQKCVGDTKVDQSYQRMSELHITL